MTIGATLYYFYLNDHVSYSLLLFFYLNDFWATLYYVLLKWPFDLLFNCFWPKWPCDLPLIIVFLSDHVSYPLLFFTYMTMWATLYYVLLKWPCDLLLIVFDLNDHVSYSLLFFFILDDHVMYSLLCFT